MIVQASRIAQLALLSVAFTTTTVSAQEDSQLCSRARGAFLNSPTPTEYPFAISSLRVCEDRGAEVIAAAWQSPPTDSTSLNALSTVSGYLQDERIFVALLEVFDDEESGLEVRVAAARAIVAQVYPCRALVASFERTSSRQFVTTASLEVMTPSASIMGELSRGDFVFERALEVFERVSLRAGPMKILSSIVKSGLRLVEERGQGKCD